MPVHTVYIHVPALSACTPPAHIPGAAVVAGRSSLGWTAAALFISPPSVTQGTYVDMKEGEEEIGGGRGDRRRERKMR